MTEDGSSAYPRVTRSVRVIPLSWGMLRILVALLIVMGVTMAAEADRSRSRSSSSARSGTGSKSSSTSVRGYTTKNGTYVAPYKRTTRDGTQTNNYSTSGNTNPYTGRTGTKRATR
jgi:hypothetical protein